MVRKLSKKKSRIVKHVGATTKKTSALINKKTNKGIKRTDKRINKVGKKIITRSLF